MLGRFDSVSQLLVRRFWPGPLTLVVPRAANCPVPLLASAGLDTIALRVPSHKLALELLRKAAVSHQIVLTKCDQLSQRELTARIDEVGSQIAKNAAAFPDILSTSSREGTGIPELRAAIARLLAERK